MEDSKGRIHCDECGMFCKFTNNYDNASDEQKEQINKGSYVIRGGYECPKCKVGCGDGTE